MNKIEQFKESFKKLIEDAPAMVPDTPPAMAPEGVPEVHADEEMNTCTVECELFRKILEHCGCNSEMADNIVQQAKLLGKSVGTLTVDHFDDLVGASEFETPVGSPDIGATSVMSAPMVTSQTYNESLRDETNEKFEVVETAEEDEDEEDNE